MSSSRGVVEDLEEPFLRPISGLVLPATANRVSIHVLVDFKLTSLAESSSSLTTWRLSSKIRRRYSVSDADNKTE
jgi:hypothetical protein